MLVIVEPFQPSLMFATKATAFPNGASPLSGKVLGLTLQHKTRLERLARDKHSSPLGALVNYGRKKFYNIGPRCHFLNLFSSSLTLLQKW